MEGEIVSLMLIKSCNSTKATIYFIVHKTVNSREMIDWVFKASFYKILYNGRKCQALHVSRSNIS